MAMTPAEAHITVHDLTMAYGSFIQRDLTSRCGAATSSSSWAAVVWEEHPAAPSDRQAPAPGGGADRRRELWEASPEAQDRLKRRFGVLFQSGALWSSMTLAENVALPLEQYTALSAAHSPAGGVEAGAGRAGRLRGLLSLTDQWGHAKAGGIGPRHGARSRYSVFR